MPKLIWTACLLLPFCANATTIVVLQTKDGVLLGTDARTVSLHVDSDGQATTTGQICKIVRTPRTAIAVAGILGNHTGFDSASFLRQNAPEDLPLNQAADKLAREMIAPLGTVILGLAESAPDQTLIEPGRPALSIVMSRFEDGLMRVAIRDVMYVGKGSSGPPEFHIRSTDCPGSCRGPNMVFAAGSTDAVTRFLLARSERLRLRDPEFALQLLHIEAGADPATVGPPFSILQGDRNGFRWIAPGACPADESSAAEASRSVGR